MIVGNISRLTFALAVYVDTIARAYGYKFDESPKTGEGRTISVALEIIKMLKSHKREQTKNRLKYGTAWEDTGYCFTRELGLPMHPDSLNAWLNEFAERHKLPHIHPHKFRHTQASLLYAAGIDPVTISSRLGHSDVSTTQDIYSHLLKNSDRKASNALSDMIRKKSIN